MQFLEVEPTVGFDGDFFSPPTFCSSFLDRFCLGQDMNVYERISFAEKREGSFIGVLMRIVE